MKESVGGLAFATPLAARLNSTHEQTCKRIGFGSPSAQSPVIMTADWVICEHSACCPPSPPPSLAPLSHTHPLIWPRITAAIRWMRKGARNGNVKGSMVAVKAQNVFKTRYESINHVLVSFFLGICTLERHVNGTHQTQKVQFYQFRVGQELRHMSVNFKRRDCLSRARCCHVRNLGSEWPKKEKSDCGTGSPADPGPWQQQQRATVLARSVSRHWRTHTVLAKTPECSRGLRVSQQMTSQIRPSRWEHVWPGDVRFHQQYRSHSGRRIYAAIPRSRPTQASGTESDPDMQHCRLWTLEKHLRAISDTDLRVFLEAVKTVLISSNDFKSPILWISTEHLKNS